MSDKCDHSFVHLESRFRAEAGGYSTHYIRTDTFFCQKCLEYRNLTKDEWSRERPEWWRAS